MNHGRLFQFLEDFCSVRNVLFRRDARASRDAAIQAPISRDGNVKVGICRWLVADGAVSDRCPPRRGPRCRVA